MKIKDGFMMREVAGKYVVVPVGAGANTFKDDSNERTGCFFVDKVKRRTDKGKLNRSS